MRMRSSSGRSAFIAFNYLFLSITVFLCLLPIINVLAISFSSSWAATGGLVKLWPVDFTLKSYEYVLHKPEFIRSVLVSVERVVLGVSINMVLTVMTAYVLSREKKDLRMRTFYSWFFIITILFSGGLIPFYMTVSAVGLIDSIWALVLPTGVPVFNILILLNFFRQLPKEIEEAVFLEGGGHWTNLMRFQVPLAKPAIATLILFSTVNHWNSWFDGLILMNNPKNYPLQSYLYTIVKTIEQQLSNLSIQDYKLLSQVSDRTTKAAQVFLAALPIMCLYIPLQKYFMKGIVLGSIKG